MTERKLMLVSNAPWAASGYGQQVALFLPYFQELGYEVAVSSFYGLEGGMGEWNGVRVYPTDHTRLLKYRLPQYVKHFAGRAPVEDVLVITLMDVWTLVDPRFGGAHFWDELRLASWTPVDHDPVPPRVLDGLVATGSRPIAMSRFGREQITLYGRNREVDFRTQYVPHGVDTDLFQPRDKTTMREGMKIPADAFVIGMVANNQGNSPPRKAFPQVLQAFAKFCETHDDAFLYLHTDVYGFNDGVNLLALSNICGIPPDRIAAVDQLKYHLGTLDGEMMGYVYSAMDVLANPSLGEGFGIPIVEAQACGVPVIVTDWTSMPELRGAGWLVRGDRTYDPAHGSFWMVPNVYEIVDAFESAYAARGDGRLAAEAREFALDYDATRVARRFWQPTLESLEEPTEIPPLRARPNRAARRARAMAKS